MVKRVGRNSNLEMSFIVYAIFDLVLKSDIAFSKFKYN